MTTYVAIRFMQVDIVTIFKSVGLRLNPTFAPLEQIYGIIVVRITVILAGQTYLLQYNPYETAWLYHPMHFPFITCLYSFAKKSFQCVFLFAAGTTKLLA